MTEQAWLPKTEEDICKVLKHSIPVEASIIAVAVFNYVRTSPNQDFKDAVLRSPLLAFLSEKGEQILKFGLIAEQLEKEADNG